MQLETDGKSVGVIILEYMIDLVCVEWNFLVVGILCVIDVDVVDVVDIVVVVLGSKPPTY